VTGPIVITLTADEARRIRSFGAACEAVHADHASSRPLSDGYEAVGKAGEVALGRHMGWEVNWSVLPGGDGRVDFMVSGAGGVTVDVKTARKPFNLLREVDKPHANILVLAGYAFVDGHHVVTLYGWERDAAMLREPVKDFGYGIDNHYLPRARLRDMATLASSDISE
jgi:hypothetical protein